MDVNAASQASTFAERSPEAVAKTRIAVRAVEERNVGIPDVGGREFPTDVKNAGEEVAGPHCKDGPVPQLAIQIAICYELFAQPVDSSEIGKIDQQMNSAPTGLGLGVARNLGTEDESVAVKADGKSRLAAWERPVAG